MTRAGSKAKSSRAAGMALFDNLGMPQYRHENSLLSLVTRLPAQPPIISRPLVTRDPNTEIQIHTQRSQLIALGKPARNIVKDRGRTLSSNAKMLGKMLREKTSRSVQIPPEQEENEDEDECKISETIRMFRTGNRIEWVQVLKAVNIPSGIGKTIGAIVEKGNNMPVVSAVSGWRATNTSDGNLLNSSAWTEAVRQFCKSIQYKLPRHCYDLDYEGQYKACHIEKRLALYFVSNLLFNEATGVFDRRKQRDIYGRAEPIEGLLLLDKRPCTDCQNFLEVLGRLTGVKFGFELSPVLGRTETVKTGEGKTARLLCDGNSSISTALTGRFARPGVPRTSRNKTTLPMIQKYRSTGKGSRPMVIPTPPRAAIEVDVAFTKNPRITVLVPLRMMTPKSSLPQAPFRQKSPSRTMRQSRTPNRAVRRSGHGHGLWAAPPASQNIFQTCSDILDKLDRKRTPRKRGTRNNPFVL